MSVLCNTALSVLIKVKILLRIKIFFEILERLSMTFTANGKHDHVTMFPPFLTFAVCFLPFFTWRGEVSR